MPEEIEDEPEKEKTEEEKAKEKEEKEKAEKDNAGGGEDAPSSQVKGFLTVLNATTKVVNEIAYKLSQTGSIQGEDWNKFIKLYSEMVGIVSPKK